MLAPGKDHVFALFYAGLEAFACQDDAYLVVNCPLGSRSSQVVGVESFSKGE